ncbi:hypothetical protein [Deinococcus peraridilitoris]|uniref:4-oxalocrotonate tautomerase domain-containing protein n=1 Tax=Deinococcus peraridilitoris (strain DSM 19664 / LMG 22246 / CIP 109416 / KR-200) TaxID=937777 RepID=K9ZZU5_DEIPD|nr:hypothetical protein [Deinococcus peraridilitoris]AFZ66719.1 hypothetical protein Deipe_1161 [Deinococcus peraridilitoris DSM 19664]
MKRPRLVSIRYAPTRDLSERVQAEQHLVESIQTALGEDVQVLFEEISDDEYWKRTRVRITGPWAQPRNVVFAAVSLCLGEVVEAA